MDFTQRQLEIMTILDIDPKTYSDTDLLALDLQKSYKKYLKSQQLQSNTIVEIENNNSSSIVEHEAVTGKISEEILNYLKSRGLDEEKAVSMFISGYFREVFDKLPFEFAVEAKKLIEMKIEGF